MITKLKLLKITNFQQNLIDLSSHEINFKIIPKNNKSYYFTTFNLVKNYQ